MKKNRKPKLIPPPPGPDASWEEQAAYFEMYDSEQLEAAGYVQELTPEDQKIVEGVRQEAGRLIAARKDRKAT